MLSPSSMKNPMKIAYLTDYDSSDINCWSGLGFYIRESLAKSGASVLPLGPLRQRYDAWTRAKKLAYASLFKKNYIRNLDSLVVNSYVSQANKLIQKNINAIDIVFSTSSILLAELETEKPMAFWSDATFGGMLDFYSGFTNLSPETLECGHRLEQKALSRCSLAIYASEWAAKSALKHYDVDASKIKVVPFGANLTCSRTASDIKNLVAKKSTSTCNLLFIGVDWDRKGGDIALKVVQSLNEKGIETKLHVAGCVPPKPLPSCVINHGYISKRTTAGQNYLDRLFSQSHFLILPSKAECYGVVFAEASSFGLPSLSNNIGGIPTAIAYGKNGWTVDPVDDISTYTEIIAATIRNKDLYLLHSLLSFKEYTDRLDWRVSGRIALECINDLLH